MNPEIEDRIHSDGYERKGGGGSDMCYLFFSITLLLAHSTTSDILNVCSPPGDVKHGHPASTHRSIVFGENEGILISIFDVFLFFHFDLFLSLINII